MWSVCMQRFLSGLFAVIGAFSCAAEPALPGLQGTWRLVTFIRDGKADIIETRFGARTSDLTIAGNRLGGGYAIRWGDKDSHFIAKIRVAPKEGQPNEIDIILHTTESTQNGDTTTDETTTRGIYALRGNELIICISDLADSRPTDFSPELGVTIWRYKRVDPAKTGNQH